MCNAWNHSPYCTCGWGGAGHFGRPARNEYTNHAKWPVGIPPINGSINSITVPNAQCPVCSALVFYYCNEYGSSVFFDELGPPWPKHPCTNHTVIAQPIAPSAGAVTSYSRAPHWSREGWHLAIVDRVASIDKHVYEIGVRDKVSNTDHSLYATTRQATDNIDIIGTFLKNSLVFIRLVRPGVFSLTTLGHALKPVQFEAFSSRIALHEQMRLAVHFLHGRHQRKGYKTSVLVEINSKPVKTNTTMSEAFAKAEQHYSTFKRTR